MASTRSSGCLALIVVVVILVVATLMGVPQGLTTRSYEEHEDQLPNNDDSSEDTSTTSDLGLTGVVPYDDGVVGRQLESIADGAGTSVEVSHVSMDLPTTAHELLEHYKSEEACLLRSAGYLDLLGRVWGCVVQGPQWVDVCVVAEDGDGMSTTRSVRLTAQEEGLLNVLQTSL